MKQPELIRLVRLWQKRLRLQDWDVTPIVRTVADMPDTLGEIAPDEGEMKAPMSIREDQGEATVVHELLHLRLWPYSDGDANEPNHEARETAINLLADCFVRAYPRRKR